jgi:hypothetical protein
MPIDRGALDEQLQSLGEGSRWWEHRELRDLPKVLRADEHVLAIARGKVGRVRWVRRSWLLLVTDRRVLCLRSSGHASWRQLEIGMEQISRVSLRIGLFRGRVLIGAGAEKLRLLAPRTEAYKLYAAASSLTKGGREGLTGFGPTRMVRRMMDHVLALPAAAFGPDPAPARLPPPQRDPVLEQRVDMLEEQVQELQRQVEFLEKLLRDRQLASLPGAGPGTD